MADHSNPDPSSTLSPDPSPTRYGLIDAKVAATMSGLQLLQGIAAGTLPAPPIGKTLNFRLAEVSDGRSLFTGTPGIEVYNPLGVVHGGYLAVLLDSAMGVAVHSKLAAGQSYTTLEFKVNFVRPVTASTGEVRAEGTIVHVGKRTAVAEAKLVDAQGKLYATASTTCIIL
ncbi:MAG: PaaI family thioesterase [Acidobacteriales bacterium]|nr:PaaI family thioesterase [Terriglobales bacterium]